MKKSLLLVCAIAIIPGWASAHDHHAYPFVAPVAGPTVTPATPPVLVMPVGPPQTQVVVTQASPPVVVAPQSMVSIYQHIAMIETSEELRALLSSPERLRQLANDPLARQFLRERLTAREVAASAGVSPEYLNWLYETMIVHGDRLDPAVIIPNFRLYPAQSVAIWPQIQTRLYPGGPVVPATTTTWTARVTTRHPHAHIHSAPSARAPKIARPPAGSTVTVVAESGDWYMVKLDGLVGYGHKYELAPVTAPAPVVAVGGAETVIAWRGGYDTPYGWVYPRATQNIERIR